MQHTVVCPEYLILLLLAQHNSKGICERFKAICKIYTVTSISQSVLGYAKRSMRLIDIFNRLLTCTCQIKDSEIFISILMRLLKFVNKEKI